MEVDERVETEDEEEQDDYLLLRNISLRNYQIKIFDEAKKSNSIIYLPTGAGKTLIAVNVLCSRASDIKRHFSEGGKRAFFTCTTKVLVYQTGKVLQTHTRFKIGCFTGDMNVDLWSREKWLTEFEKSQVIVLTGEILRQLLELEIILPERISLVVFDECHNAVADHPYRLIMQTLSSVDLSQPPLLLGLTAVLLNSNIREDQILPTVQCLERSMGGKVVTVEEFHDVLRVAADPVDKIIVYEEASPSHLSETISLLYNKVIALFKDMVIKETESPVIPSGGSDYKKRNKAKRIKNDFVNSKAHFEELGFTGGLLSTLFYTLLFEKYRLLSQDSVEIQTLIFAKTELSKIRKAIYRQIGEEETGPWLLRHSSPKLQQLLHLIRDVNEKANGGRISTLVFVRQRGMAVILAYLLKRLSIVDETFRSIKADFVVGSSPMNKESVLLECKNEEIVKQFASGTLNVLISTNILEEGVDVSGCNVVISFDFPLSYPSYFQSRGRARDKQSSYYIFVKKSEEVEKNNLLNHFKVIQKKLHKGVLADYELEENQDLEEEVEKMSIPGKTRLISMNGITAIKVVYRYCSALPQDKYCLLAPTAWYEEVLENKKAFVRLPINCPLKEVIEGQPCKNKKLAKRSAFLAVVERLLKAGELDDDLNPRSFALNDKYYCHLFPHYKEEKIDKNLPQPGTKKRNQIYKVKFAESLCSCLPGPGVKAYLHVIDLTVVFDKPELQRKVALYDILRIPVTFALITTKKLFQIFKFPLFLDMGQINCDLLVNYDEIFLTESELQDIKACHFTLFNTVTRVLKSCQVFDNRNKEHSFLVVPVEKNAVDRFDLNWDVIRCDFCRNSKSALVRYNPTANRNSNSDPGWRLNRALGLCRPSEESNSLVPQNAISGGFLWTLDTNAEKKPKFAMNEADYRYFVIAPNYRNQHPPQCYIVNKFCHDMSPLSPFSDEYEDFLSYYNDKYEIEITNLKQPLLRVSALYSCSNFNRPRNATSKARRAKERHKEYEELLIPELCNVIPFDRRFWLKALLLPTILNRIYHVYAVEEFRRKIVSETGLGASEFPTFKSLTVDNVKVQDDEDASSDDKNLGGANISLPLSKLKDKSKPNRKIILDPERHMYEVGLCDQEYFVKYLNEIDEEHFDPGRILSMKNEEVINLESLHNVPVPPLALLKGNGNKMGPELAEMVQACTSKAANDIVDYERFEVLGDCFLKFAVSLFLFRNYEDNEGILTTLKQKIVGNRNLLYCGLAKNVQDVINVNDFVPLSDWNPPLLNVPEKLAGDIISKNVDPAVLYRFEIPVEEQFSGVLSENTLRRNEEMVEQYEKPYQVPTCSLLPYKTVNDKTVADCIEALIGVYLLTLGLPGAFEFLLWLGVLPKPNGSYSELMEKTYQSRLLGPEANDLVMIALEEVLYSGLEDTLDYHFRDKALLLEALTHSSYSVRRITDCYQRLEFLGDAILDFLITAHVYENCSGLSPGQVTDIRSSLVNNITFACFVVRYELHKYLLSFSSNLRTSIQDFVSFQENRNHVIDDNVLILLEENDCLIAESVQVPKVLGDLFESLAGAIYLDSGNSLETVWRIYYRLMKREIDEFIKTVPKTPVRLLQEICGDKPYYETKVLGNKVKVSCSVYYENREIKTHGFGVNKKEGKKSASKLALNKILSLKK